MRFAALFIGVVSLLPAQQNPPAAAAAPQQPVIRTGAQEVLLDLIVRDKKGKPIKDLKVEEVEVYDEGTKQKISGFGLLTGTEPAGVTDPTQIEQKRLDPLRQLRLVSLLFQGMGDSERRMARAAALDFIKNPLEQNVYMSVFIIDRQLHALQQFTNDREKLKQAIERATGGNFMEYQQISSAIRRDLEAAKAGSAGAQQALAATPAPGRGAPETGAIGNAAAQATVTQMTLDILRHSENLSTTDWGRATLFSLQALMKDQATLPGRKTVVFFAPGIGLNDQLTEYFKDTIASANSAGVSVYGVDPRGVQIESENASSKDMLEGAAWNTSQQTNNNVGAVSAGQVKAGEEARSSILGNAKASLQALAVSTGGKLIADTNDLRAPLNRIREDVLMYYQVSYNPGIQEWDGKFRRIQVRVPGRKDLVIQARNGYYALPPHTASVTSFEMPLLSILSAAEMPKNFAFHVGALRFQKTPENKFNHGLVIEVPYKDLTFAEEKENKRYRGHVSFLIVIKDQAGEVVQRYSRDLGFFSEADKLDTFKKRGFTGTFLLDLAPGRYTLETAVLDVEGMKPSGRRTTLVVPAPALGVGISTVTLVRRTENPQSGADPNDPFVIQGKRIVPTLDPTFRISSDALSFYFIVSAAAGDKPTLLMELSKDGQVIAQAPLPLPAADARGLIPYLGALPLPKFPPGNYDLRLMTQLGATKAEEHTPFVVEP